MLATTSTLAAIRQAGAASPGERVLRDDYGHRVIVGPNQRGGFGFRFPGQAEMFGSYATLPDVERMCAIEGYKFEGEIRPSPSTQN